MPGDLLNPDNRLLGGSINDLSLYGATSPPDGTPPLSSISATFTNPSSAEPGSPASAAHNAIVTTAVEPVESFQRPIDDVATGSAAPAFSFQPAASPTPQIEISPAAAPETGSGSVAPIGPAAIGSQSADGPASGDPSPTTDVASSLIPDTPLHVTAPLIETLGATTQTLDAATAQLDDVLLATEAVGTTVTAAVGDVVDALAATDTATPLAQVNDLLTGIGGTDPAGGVDTLVSMVAAADHYDLSHAVAELPEASPLVDLLAIDGADAPLLGGVDLPALDSDDHHSLLGL